jgi:hypothetical protein
MDHKWYPIIGRNQYAEQFQSNLSKNPRGFFFAPGDRMLINNAARFRFLRPMPDKTRTKN